MLDRRKTALVTGASSGIGRELAYQLVTNRGMTVVVTARRRDRLEELARECPKGQILIIDGDLGDPEFRSRLWTEAENLTGGIELLINNAGMGDYSSFEEQDFQAIRKMIDINITAVIDLTRLALKSMISRQSGQIVQVSSVLGFFGVPYSSVYVATKHAVNGFVKSLRHELHGTGVKVWATCPGRTESEFRQTASRGRMQSSNGEPTKKVVQGIIHALDKQHGPFHFPTWKSRLITTLTQWLPLPFNAFMNRWGRNLVKQSYLDAQK